MFEAEWIIFLSFGEYGSFLSLCEKVDHACGAILVDPIHTPYAGSKPVMSVVRCCRRPVSPPLLPFTFLIHVLVSKVYLFLRVRRRSTWNNLDPGMR